MNIVPLADVKARFSAYIKKTQDGPIIVTKNGRQVAVLLGITDEDDLERIFLANSTRFQSMLDAAERRIQEPGGICYADLWGQVEIVDGT